MTPACHSWNRVGSIAEIPEGEVRAFDLPTVERSGGNGAVGADGPTYKIDLRTIVQ